MESASNPSRGCKRITSRFDGMLENECMGGTPWPPLLKDRFFVRRSLREWSRRTSGIGGPHVAASVTHPPGKPVASGTVEKFGLRKRQENNFPFSRGVHRRVAETAETNAERDDALRLSQRSPRLCGEASASSAVPILCLTRASKTRSNFFTRPKHASSTLCPAKSSPVNIPPAKDPRS